MTTYLKLDFIHNRVYCQKLSRLIGKAYFCKLARASVLTKPISGNCKVIMQTPRTIGRRLSKILRAYHLGPDHPMKIRLWDLLRRGMGYPRFTLPYAGTAWITLDERDLVQRQVYLGGVYEPEVWAAIAAKIAPDSVIWDVGAHVGTFTIQALADARVRECHAFEPDPSQADILAYNLMLNRTGGVIHRCALSDRQETRLFFHGPEANVGVSSFIARYGGKPISVDSQTADSLIFEFGLPAPDLLKIDVEGWELHVLRGMARLFRERPPQALVVESASTATGDLEDPMLAELLHNFGYSVRHLKRENGEIEAFENYLAWRILTI